MHDGFSRAFAEGGVEAVAVVEGEVVAREGLAAVFVDALEDLWWDENVLSSINVGVLGGGFFLTLYPAA